MKSPLIATVLAKVANLPRCGEFRCEQNHLSAVPHWLLNVDAKAREVAARVRPEETATRTA